MPKINIKRCLTIKQLKGIIKDMADDGVVTLYDEEADQKFLEVDYWWFTEKSKCIFGTDMLAIKINREG